MKHSNEDAMGIGAMVFGVFCLFVMIGGIIFIASVNSQQSPITDTYGNTVSPVTNQSKDLVTDISSTGQSTMVPLVLIVGAVLVCAVVFLLWLASKAR